VMQVKTGDRVLFESYSPVEVKVGSDEYLVIEETSIMAIIE
jgi:co-chaperonin GroES (HSP10)